MPLGNTLNILRPPERATPVVQTRWNEDLVKNLHDVMGRMSQQITASGIGSGTGSTRFGTKALLEAATIPLVVTSINLTGYFAAGDGGGSLYVRVGSEPSHALKIQSADGAWWEFVPNMDATVNTKQAGGKSDGSTNDAAALISCLALGIRVIVPVDTVITLVANQVKTFIDNLNLISPQEVMTFTLPAGETSITDPVNLTNPDADKMTIVGASGTLTAITAVSKTSGATKNWVIKYTLADGSGFAVDDYLITTGTTIAGTGEYKIVAGCYKVTAVSSNEVTVKHTLNAASWPTLTVSAGDVYPLKTILRWPTTERGLSIAGCSLRGLRNIVIASSFNITTTSPSDTASDGIQVGAAPDTLQTGLNESEQTNAGSIWCKQVGIVEWSGNGVQALGGNFYGTFTASCSNGWRGFQASRAGSCAVKASAAVGNGASGYEAEAGGFTNAANSVAAGNAGQGVFCIGPSSVQFNLGHALRNVLAGLDARNYGSILADGATVEDNIVYGCYSIAGNILFGVSATAASNGTFDINCTEGGMINCTGASAIGVLGGDDDSGAIIIHTDGEVRWGVHQILEHAASGHKMKWQISSAGDLTLSFDNAGGGSYTDELIFKTDGVIIPSTNDGPSLGRSANQWSSIWSAGPIMLGIFTVGGLPSASTFDHGLIIVSDETGGETLAFSDGTNWLRAQDRAVVS